MLASMNQMPTKMSPLSLTRFISTLNLLPFFPNPSAGFNEAGLKRTKICRIYLNGQYREHEGSMPACGRL